MKSQAKKIELDNCNKIDDVVKALKSYRKKGENVYMVFNDNKLYSEDVTMDSAYLQILGLTRKEDSMIKSEIKKAKSVEEQKNLVIKWSEIVEKHIRESKQKAEKCDKKFDNLDGITEFLVESKLNGDNIYIEYENKRLYSVDATPDKIFLQAKGLTKAEDIKFKAKIKLAENQEEKDKIVNEWERTKTAHVQEIKKDAKRASNPFLGSIDDAVNYLQEQNQLGENVYVEFDGVKLYSYDVTLDNAYLRILGMTKEEDESFKKEMEKTSNSDESKEIYERWANIKEEHLQNYKKRAKPAPKQYLGNLKNAVDYLKECDDFGDNVYIDFNDKRIYSYGIDLDNAYMHVIGLTYAEDQDIKEKMEKASTPEEKQKVVNEYSEIIEENMSKRKERAKEFKDDSLNSLDEYVSILSSAKRDGENIYTVFEGHKLYSVDITPDKAYMDVVGLTKTESEELNRKLELAIGDEEKALVQIEKDEIIKQHKEAAERQSKQTKKFEKTAELKTEDLLASAINATEKITTEKSMMAQAEQLEKIEKENKEIEMNKNNESNN